MATRTADREGTAMELVAAFAVGLAAGIVTGAAVGYVVGMLSRWGLAPPTVSVTRRCT